MKEFIPSANLATGDNDDGFQRLYTPHRVTYIRGEGKPKDPNDPTFNPELDCPFCMGPKQWDNSTQDYTDNDLTTVADPPNLVVAKGQYCFAVLNLYPYNTGHLMICPYRHTGQYIDLSEKELTEFSLWTQKAIRVLTFVYEPDGFNLGVNQGQIAGAGIAAHLHQHIIPRWIGDANFFPLVGKTRTVSEFLAQTRLKVAKAWAEIA